MASVGFEGEGDPRRVMAGYKATISNPNTSEDTSIVLVLADVRSQAKQHAREQLDGGAREAGEQAQEDVAGLPMNEGNVIGGIKATTHNDTLSDETQADAQKRLDELNA